MMVKQLEAEQEEKIPERPEKELADAFRLFDTKLDSKIDWDELKAALEIAGETVEVWRHLIFWWHILVTFYFLGLGSWRIDAWWWQEQRLGYWLWWIYQYDEVCSSFSIRQFLIGRQIRCQCGREFHPSWISVWSGWNRLDPIPNLETFNC